MVSLFLAWHAYLLDPVLPIITIVFGGFASFPSILLYQTNSGTILGG